MMAFHLQPDSRNGKTGRMPVSTSGAETCSDACPLKGNGCFADGYPLKGRWDEVTDGRRGGSWSSFVGQVSMIATGTLWRHNQAGDLPGEGDAIDAVALAQLVEANHGKLGFTYTHKPVTYTGNLAAIAAANAGGFTVNLSANNLRHADELAATGLPVAVVLPASVSGNVKLETPEGRRVVVCPATYRDDVTCKSCGLCQVRDRKVIVGFPAHGGAKRKASNVAEG